MNDKRLLFVPIGAGLFVDGYELAITASVIVLLPHSWLLNVQNIGYVGASVVFGTIIGALVSGPLSDLYGRQKLLIIDMLFISLCAFLSSLSWNIDVLIFLRFLTGFSIGADYPLSSAYLVDILPKEYRGKYMAVTIGFWMFGAITAALFGYFLSDVKSGWRFMLAIGSIFPIIILFFRKSIINNESKILNEHKSTFFHDLINSLKSNKKRVVLAILPRFFLDFIGYSFHLYLPLMLLVSGVSSKTDSLKFNFLFMASFVFGWIPCVLLIDRIGRIKLQYIGFLGSGISLLIIFLIVSYFNFNIFALILFIIIFQISSFFGPSVTAWILPVELFNRNIRSTWQSISTLVAHAGGLFAALIIPISVHRIGLGNVFLFLSFLSFFAAIITYLFRYETMLSDLN